MDPYSKKSDKIWDMERRYGEFIPNRQYGVDEERFRRNPHDIDGTFRDVGYR